MLGNGNFFDDFFDGLTGSWNRSFKEKDGYQVMEAKNGYIIAFNTLGVKSSDIKVTHQPAVDRNNLGQVDRYGRKIEYTYFRVSGYTKIPELNDQVYSVNYEILFKNVNPIDEVQYMVKDGLTIVYIKTKEPTESLGSNAKSIEDGGSFDW